MANSNSKSGFPDSFNWLSDYFFPDTISSTCAYTPYLLSLHSRAQFNREVVVRSIYDQSLHEKLSFSSEEYIFSSLWHGSDASSSLIWQYDKLGGVFRSLHVIYRSLAANQRAILECLSLYARSVENPELLRILVAEPFSSLALEIRGRYPYALSTCYSPANEDSFWPIPHIDLQNIAIPNARFNVVVSCEVLEHIPDYRASLREVCRILLVGGVYLFTCPFYWNQADVTTRASLLSTGEVIHHLNPPEYHGDPLRPEEGALVFHSFGWNILDEIQRAGFSSSSCCFISNPMAGIIGQHISGCFVFIARK